ncbi:unnamed protein product [Phytophthora fragariaefolia]|uniref:Unnamed protein product n=1 Tax=Phytophthora fragariaefolia TaxID=1490495 RepID=A0A9W7D0Q7_9STRA|nr:unnamed protein product [Phytophthora fragariaefolia]
MNAQLGVSARPENRLPCVIVWDMVANPAPSSTILAADILDAINELAVTQPTLQPAAVCETEMFYRNTNASGIRRLKFKGAFIAQHSKASKTIFP